MPETTTTPDLHIVRGFAAPREIVFRAWAEEEQLLAWFGPRVFPAVSWKHDFRPGGSFEYVMQGPGGVQAPGSGEYEEIIDGERIVGVSEIANDDGHVIFKVRQTYDFTDLPDGTTQIELNVYVLHNEDFPGLAGMEQGWDETLDKLAEHLQRTAS